MLHRKKISLNLKKAIKNNSFCKLFEIQNLSINEHNIKNGISHSLSTSEEMVAYIDDKYFQNKGSKKALIQADLPNSYILVTKDLTPNSCIEMTLGSELVIDPEDQQVQLEILFRELLGIFYEETKKIKGREIPYDAHRTLKVYHNKNYRLKKNNLDNILNIKLFDWHLDRNRKLTTNQLKVVLAIFLNFNSWQTEKYFNINRHHKSKLVKGIKKQLELEKTSTSCDILLECRRLKIIKALEAVVF